MVASKLIVSGILATQASAAILFGDLAQLHDRADTDLSPGSALYNCHDNCGQAILESGYDSSDVLCSDSVFLTDYANCLECAGTDNEDIWKYYGSSLTSAAAECGLATTPLSGTQASVGTAEPAVSGGAAAATTTTDASASSSSTSSAAVATSTTAAAESSAAVAVTIAAATTSATATASTAATTSAAVSSVAYSSVSGSVSGTGSYTTSSSLSVVTAGAGNRQAAAGLAGVVALGAAYAVVY